MEQAISAMYDKGLYILLFTAVLVVGILVTIIFPGKTVKQQNKSALFTIAFVMVIISFTVLVTIPFAKDFFDKNIVVAQGVYCNVLGSEKKSSSSLMGIYSVTLENKDGMIKLTTAPWRNDVFVIGEYNVTAYYLPASKTLLHIEINI